MDYPGGDRNNMTRIAQDELFDDEYGAISLRVNGGMLSILLFVVQLFAPYVVRLQPWRPEKFWLWPMVTPLVIFVLATFGLLAAWGSRRRGQASSATRFGLLLNGVVFGILLLWGLLIFMIVSAGRSTVFRPTSQPVQPKGSVNGSEFVGHDRGAAVEIDGLQTDHLLLVVES